MTRRRPVPALALAAAASLWLAAAAAAAPGDPDASLGPGGVLTVSVPNDRDEYPRGAVTDAAGRVLVAGSAAVDGRDTVYVQRFLPDGRRDPAWSRRYPYPTPDGVEVAGVAAHPAGGFVVAGTQRSSSGVSRIVVVRVAADGFRDPAFGSFGSAFVDVAGASETAGAVAVQPDGRVVVAGTATRTGGPWTMLAARLTANGLPDAAFGGDGVVEVDAGDAGGTDEGLAVAYHPGSVLVAGRAQAGDGTVMAVARLSEATGAPVAAFDGDGVALVDFATASDESVSDVAVVDPASSVPGARVILAGSATSTFGGAPAVRQAAVVALDLDTGAPDAAFDGDGKVLTRLDGPAGSHDVVASALVHADPDPVAAGGETITVAAVRAPAGTGEGRPTLLRYAAATGALDGAFGAGGVAALPAGRDAHARDVWVDAAGRVAALFETSEVGGVDTVVARTTAGGAPDPAFAGGGVAVYDLGDLDGEGLRDVTAHPAGGVVASGFAVSGGARRVMVARVAEDGGLVPGFGAGGVATPVLPGLAVAEATSVAVDGDGRILVAGDGTAAGAPTAFVARLTAAGAPDPAFGAGGVVRLPVGASRPVVAADVARRPVVAYTRFPEVGVQRLDAAGTPDPGFSGDGHVAVDTGLIESVRAVTVTPEGGVLVAATGSAVVASEGRALVVAFTADGAADTGVAPGGVLRIDAPQGLFDSPMAVRRDAAGGVVTVGVTWEGVVPGGSRTWTSRHLPGGAADPAYRGGTAGPLVATPAFGIDGAFLPDGRPLAFAFTGGGPYAFIRGTLDGAPDPAFGVGGVAPVTSLPPGLFTDVTTAAVAVQGDGRAVAAGAAAAPATGEQNGVVLRVQGDVADLAVAAPPRVAAAAGSPVAVQATVSSAGPQAASGTSVRVSVPAGTELVSLAADGASCAATTCALPAVAAGERRTVTAVMRAPAGDHPVAFEVASLTADPTPGDHRAEVVVAAAAPAPAAARDTTAPRLAVRVATARRAALRRGLRVTVTAGEAVTGRLVVTRPGRPRQVLGAAPVRLTVAGRRTVTVRLTPAGLRRLGAGRAVVVTFRAADAAGNASSAARRVTLR